jgi:hypothetical protein
MDPALVGDLVGMCHRDAPDAIPAKMVLEDLFGAGPLRRESTPAFPDAAAKKRALESLIEALSKAKGYSYAMPGPASSSRTRSTRLT